MSEAVLDEFADLDLYAALELSRDAPQDAVRKAYLRRALATHPDKPGGHAETFRQVSFAYSVLRDERRRAQYDETGSVDDADEARIADLFAKAVRTEITEEMIAEDRRAYQGSAEERRDVFRQYKKHGGDYNLVFESVVHADETEHERLIAVIKEGIASGELAATPKFKQTTSKAALKRRRAKAGKEAAEVAASRAALGVETEQGLAALIRSRQQQRFGGLVDKLERKYKVGKR